MTCYFFRTRRGICLLKVQDIYSAKWKWMQILLPSLQIVSILAPFFKGAHFPALTSEHWFQQMFCKMERMQSISVCWEEPVFIPLGCWRFYAEQLGWPPLVGEKIGVLHSLACLSDGSFICSVKVFKAALYDIPLHDIPLHIILLPELSQLQKKLRPMNYALR